MSSLGTFFLWNGCRWNVLSGNFFLWNVCQWNFLSKNFFFYEMWSRGTFFLWNVLSRNFFLWIVCLWNVLPRNFFSMKCLFMKCPVFERSSLWFCFLWNVLLWNVPILKNNVVDISFMHQMSDKMKISWLKDYLVQILYNS